MHGRDDQILSVSSGLLLIIGIYILETPIVRDVNASNPKGTTYIGPRQDIVCSKLESLDNGIVEHEVRKREVHAVLE